MQVQRNGADSQPSDAFVSWRWDDWIRPQIDAAVALGANTVKWSGGTRSVVDGRQTRSQFHAHISQFIEYAEAQGLHVYWSSHFYEEDLNPAFDAATLDEIVAMLALVGSYENVIANDCSNEINLHASEADALAHMQACYPAIKDVAPNLPLTVSVNLNGSWTQPPNWTNHALSPFEPYVDLWDFHPYYGFSLDQLAPFRAADYYKQWFVGECGERLAAGQSAQLTRYSSLDSLSQVPDCGGIVGYTIKDATGSHGGTYTDDYGMYAYDTGEERPWLTTAFKNWPDSYTL